MDSVKPDMTPAKTAGQAADRAARNAAITLALTLPGDTVLYLLLPIYAATFGVSLPEAGLLLAANRIVRIFGNGWIARFYAERGPRLTCMLAAFGSIAAALAYATTTGVWALLIARLVWGLSFSGMNIANQALATSVGEGAARRMGQSRTIVAVGPTIGLLAGALIAYHFGPRVVFLLLAGVACLAPFFAWHLPSTREVTERKSTRIAWPDAMSVWSFATGFTLDGLFIFGLGLLAAANYPRDAVLAAGGAMALRYAVEIAFSSAGGRSRPALRGTADADPSDPVLRRFLGAARGRWRVPLVGRGGDDRPARAARDVVGARRRRGLSGTGPRARARRQRHVARYRRGPWTLDRRIRLRLRAGLGDLRLRRALAGVDECAAHAPWARRAS